MDPQASKLSGFELSSAAFGEELNPFAVPIREDLVGDSDPAPSFEDLDG